MELEDAGKILNIGHKLFVEMNHLRSICFNLSNRPHAPDVGKMFTHLEEIKKLSNKLFNYFKEQYKIARKVFELEKQKEKITHGW